MATASVTYTFIALSKAIAAQVNTNFTNVVNFLNNSVVHRDGSKAMTGSLDAGSNRIISVADPTGAQDAATRAFVEGMVETGDYTPTLTNVTAGSGATNTCKYKYVGGPDSTDEGIMLLDGRLILGSGSSVTGQIQIDLPSGFETDSAATINIRFNSVVKYNPTGSGTGGNVGTFQRQGAATLGTVVFDASSTYASFTSTSATVPGTWADGGTMYYQVTIPVVRT